MSDQKLKIAVFIDFDNIEIGVKTTLNGSFDIGAVLEAIKERGEVITKVAYGDWKRSGDHGRAMAQHAVRMVQRVMTPGGDKNGADINLALDALEMAFTHAHINAFVIVGGDSDFITLVEKLKQYDRKVFVVGGRAFTSQVMQKNCTEFIAYENVVSDLSTAGGSARAEARPDRGRRHGPGKADRPRAASNQTIDQALPLVQRALKVLSDREVSPQLGLLKSTLLQLDSSFSERDYGAGTFREFAEKLAQHGLVVLKHQGRSTLVELPGSEPVTSAEPPAVAEPANLTELLEQPDSVPQDFDGAPSRPAEKSDVSLGDGVALVRRVLADTTASPRWPMYPRQFKQFLRTAQPDFDERKYGSIADLMRACQKDGLLRLERDRQGALRVFASGSSSRASVPHGWGVGARDNSGSQLAPEGDAPPVVDISPLAVVDAEPPPVVEAQVTAIVEDAPAAPAPKAKRASKARKAAGAEKKKAPARKKKAS
ncbi:MAG TPA: NYN domain-containing protein [Vicinamibacterales bacterium]|nr:NYN domain-containing protein [Vicinamibacterales bacterium]